MYIDGFDFKQIEAEITEEFEYENGRPERRRDFKNLFSIFLLHASSSLQMQDKNDRRIPFAFIQKSISMQSSRRQDM